jgi:hypothetical protein
MKIKLLFYISLLLCADFLLAQNNGKDVYWHIDRNVKSCSMVIDPSLTQSQWKTFVKQVGAITSYKSLGGAQPLGTMQFIIGIEYGRTPVDQHDGAWINTFTHPDENCPLGDQVSIPTLRARMGVSDAIDIGAYWTSAPDANYGMIGAEMKYAFLLETDRYLSAAVRASATILTGVDDFDLGIYSIDLLASKKIDFITPYAGLRSSIAIGTVTTTKVALSQEIVPIAQGYLGFTSSVWIVSISAEYNIASVNTLVFALGFNF